MPTIKRSDKGIEMKGAATPVRVSTPTLEETTELPAESIGPQLREECEINDPAKQREEPKEILRHGIIWSPLDRDPNGNPHTYLCEDRAMKITVNFRRERRQVIPAGSEWLLFRMGALIFRSSKLDEVFAYATNN